MDLQDLHKYKALQLLDLSENEISDAAGLAKCPNLLSAKLENNKVESLASYTDAIKADKMENLQLLSFKGNQLTELQSLELPMLMYLNLDGNNLTSLAGTLDACKKLTKLEVRENKLTTTAGIEGLEVSAITRCTHELSPAVLLCVTHRSQGTQP